MIKNNKWKLLISSVIIVLPALAGLILWDKLGSQMAIHWGMDGAADGFGSRGFAVLGLPAILLALHWLGVAVTARDHKNKPQSPKVISLVLWICPLISLIACGTIYAAAFDRAPDALRLPLVLIGVIFIVIGNYLPKCRRNRTIGIKVIWALENEENWNATHRFAGRIWVAGGVLMLAAMLLSDKAALTILAVITIAVCALSVGFSYTYYRRQLKAGTATEVSRSHAQRRRNVLSAVFTAAVLAFAAVIMFTGNISFDMGDDSFTITASYWKDITVRYSAIESVEYRDEEAPGTRVNGFGSPRLMMGRFESDELGYYTRYTYTGCDACVLLKVDGNTLVISGRDKEATKAIYEALMSAQ